MEDAGKIYIIGDNPLGEYMKDQYPEAEVVENKPLNIHEPKRKYTSARAKRRKNKR